MGWKNIKEGFKIEHIVSVTKEGVCIGSPYIHDLIVIGHDGAIKKRNSGDLNDDLTRYQYEMDADPQKLRRLLWGPDTFSASIPVYTWEGGEIIQKFCETPGWPNVTHDGDILYENTFYTDKAKAVKRAKENAACELKHHNDRIIRLFREHESATTDAHEALRNLTKLRHDYPDQGESPTADAVQPQPAEIGHNERT